MKTANEGFTVFAADRAQSKTAAVALSAVAEDNGLTVDTNTLALCSLANAYCAAVRIRDRDGAVPEEHHAHFPRALVYLCLPKAVGIPEGYYTLSAGEGGEAALATLENQVIARGTTRVEVTRFAQQLTGYDWTVSILQDELDICCWNVSHEGSVAIVTMTCLTIQWPF